MSSPRPIELQKNLSYFVAQLEIVAASSSLDLGQLKIIYERLAQSSFQDVWPICDAFPLIQTAIKDGLDDCLAFALQVKLQSLFKQVGKPIGVPLDETVQIKFNGRTFCFTGTFELGNRRECHALVTQHGGRPTDSILQKLDYLVIGKFVSPDWKHETYGRKIEWAVEQNREPNRKKRIQIVSESFLQECASKQQKVS